jgi:hypothetical protein
MMSPNVLIQFHFAEIDHYVKLESEGEVYEKIFRR